MDYSVALVLRGKHESGRAALWEFVVLLVEASEEDEARAKAEQLAARYETDFRTVDGDTVSWRLEAVQKVALIDYGADRNGTELYSTFLTDSEARSILEPMAEDSE